MSTRTRERSDSGRGTSCRRLRSSRGRTPAACSSTSRAGSRPTPGSAPTGGWASAGVTSLRAFHIAEGMARDAEAADALLVACRDLGSRSEKRLRFDRAGDSAGRSGRLGRGVRGRSDARRLHPRWRTSWGGCSTSAVCLQLLRPELAARVRSARLPFQGRLTFRTDEGEAAIVITADDVLVDGGANGGTGRRAAPDGAGAVVPRRVRPRRTCWRACRTGRTGGGGCAARALPAADAAHLPDGPILRGTYFCCLRACLA